MDSVFDEPHCKLLISGALFSYGILLKNNTYQRKCLIEIFFLLLNFHAWPSKSHCNGNSSLEYTKYKTCTQTLTHPNTLLMCRRTNCSINSVKFFMKFFSFGFTWFSRIAVNARNIVAFISVMFIFYNGDQTN